MVTDNIKISVIKKHENMGPVKNWTIPDKLASKMFNSKKVWQDQKHSRSYEELLVSIRDFSQLRSFRIFDKSF